MNQKAFMQAFDAIAFGAFRAAGVADAAHYMEPGGTAEVPCTVLLDETVEQFTPDDVAPIATNIIRVTLQLAEITPQDGGVVRIEGTGRRLKLVQKIRADESTAMWEVANV
ncbi:head-tail joining protein [Stenotrophomonas lactitubi]|uniref:head-tail joining protein n=1 Tax=Stenotrophomonas lactitubi TaxID=2045214 RepID=UPI001E0094FD|nr:hypothetical protein [Stenotrophomonas lactitubi]CAH0139238.1 hypothetical protein SRABI122_00423 [Stenotrophomonas lactitubi]CAH0154528.1 hypothetical protein SRABI66_00799 [Stenotrophomonas lactitubi]CAH0171495.1 hypothetical protein SRABI81_01223 [Stenotrophomonas lactitubi]CAH0205023.1 hypothetical protein SRABI102_01870 [Stenotrophomonas lactitubi]